MTGIRISLHGNLVWGCVTGVRIFLQGNIAGDV